METSYYSGTGVFIDLHVGKYYIIKAADLVYEVVAIREYFEKRPDKMDFKDCYTINVIFPANIEKIGSNWSKFATPGRHYIMFRTVFHQLSKPLEFNDEQK